MLKPNDEPFSVLNGQSDKPSAGGGLAVEGLSLSIDDKPLLSNVSLDLPPAGISMILGPNGAGKTLLLRVLHGLTPPSDGTVSWNGAPMSATLRRDQAMVFQKPVLLRRSVRSNLDYACRLHATSSAISIDDLLDRVGLTGKDKQPARLLSGGEQQRLALARALATRPQILFLDESTANLDPPSVLKIEQIVQEESHNGVKIVFVSHDIAQATRLADDVVFMKQGRVIEHTSAAQFFAGPASPEAQAFLAGEIMV